MKYTKRRKTKRTSEFVFYCTFIRVLQLIYNKLHPVILSTSFAATFQSLQTSFKAAALHEAS
jgi:hypothetical protein